MNKSYYSIGLMSGTSADGVDASLANSDGKDKFNLIYNKYFIYPQDIYDEFHKLKQKILNLEDIEKEITLFHAKAVNQILKKTKTNIDFIGFHGQTIFHDPKQKISKQLGDGNLLSKLTKKKVIYNFRQNDINNGGQGAPLTPVFHQLILDQHKIKLPALIVNIGGIINVSWKKPTGKITSSDTGPGNCMIDQWMRIKSNKKYDKNGIISKKGNIDEGRLQYLYNSYIKMGLNKYLSYDIHDFNSQIQYIKDLSLKDGAATLNE